MENELIPLAENPVAKVNFKGSGRDGKTQDTVVPPAVAKAVSTNCNWQRERLSWLPYSRLFVPVKSSASVGKPWIS